MSQRTDTDADNENDPFDYPKLVEAIERCIEPENNSSIMRAVTITNEMLPHKDEDPKLRNGTSILLAEHILTVAMKIPYNHPSQIRLALYVQYMMQSEKLGNYVVDDRDESIKSDIYKFQDRWEPFWWTVREWFPTGGDTEDENLGAFYARLHGMNVDGWGAHPTCVIWAMRELENPRENRRRDIHNSATRSAALWILYSGQFAFDTVVNWPEKFSRRESDDERRLYRRGNLYDGPIHGMQRWEFWRSRLLEETANTDVDDETKQLARKAADMMAAFARNSV